MEKYSNLYSEYYICKKLKNKSKDIPIFSYCIKWDKIKFNDCIDEFLNLNEKNHRNISKEYLIKNNEKGFKFLAHPSEKNLAFWFDCHTQLCNKCLK